MTSCQKTKEGKAKELITQYLKKKLDDPSSYSSIEFGKLDSISNFNEENYANSVSIQNAMLSIVAMDSELAILDPTNKPEFLKAKVDYQKQLLKDQQEMEEDKRGWHFEMLHSFRAKNKLGVLEKFDQTFLVDTTLTNTFNVNYEK